MMMMVMMVVREILRSLDRHRGRGCSSLSCRDTEAEQKGEEGEENLHRCGCFHTLVSGAT